MPELPEVEATRRVVARHCIGHRVTRVCAIEAGGGPRDGQFDDIVLGGGAKGAPVVDATSLEVSLE